MLTYVFAYSQSIYHTHIHTLTHIHTHTHAHTHTHTLTHLSPVRSARGADRDLLELIRGRRWEIITLVVIQGHVGTVHEPASITATVVVAYM
jgi:hypothetical protein